MKVVYFSNPYFADCDFPLIKEMQSRGLNVRIYMPIGRKFSKGSILEMDKPINKWGVYQASKIEGMDKYKNCLDLNSLYFICGVNRIWWPFSWLLWFWVYFHVLFFHANILHITWQLTGLNKILFHIPFVSKKIMTVHDPLQHTGTTNEHRQEKARIRSFNWADHLILLNAQQVDIFSKTYNINQTKIFVSRLGLYDSVKYLNVKQIHLDNPYILFFGQISPYKGIKYLLDAMLKVREECSSVDLLVVGSGNFNFDTTPYTNKEFIKIENRYIGISELIGFVKDSLFVVCPYTDATQSGVVQTAFALEIPVVATNVGALPDIVKDGIYGTIVPPCNTDTLASAMIELIHNKEKLKSMKHNIKNKWIPSMSWKPIVDDYIIIYQK